MKSLIFHSASALRKTPLDSFSMILIGSGPTGPVFRRHSKIPLDRQKGLLYHTKTVGILKSIMKKIVAITLTAVLALTVLISGTSGYSDCAVRCMREAAGTHPHAAMGSTSPRLPDCCSGSMQNPCEMNTVPEVKIPECSIASHSTVVTHFKTIGMISGVADADISRILQVYLRTIVGEFYKDPPIYLQTLSLLS